MTIKQRLRLVIVIVLMGLLVSIIGVSLFSSHMIKLSRQVMHVNEPVHEKALEFQLSVVQVQQWLTDISATRGLNGLNDGFDEAQKYAVRGRELLAELTQMNPQRSELYRELGIRFDAYYQTGRQMAELYIREGPDGGNAFMGNFDKTAESINSLLAKMIDEVSVTKHDSLLELEGLVGMSKLTSIGVLLLLGLSMILALMYLGRSINLLDEIRLSAQVMADRDLSRQLTMTRRKDEIGMLSRAFETMQGSLRNTFGQIDDCSHNLDAVSASMTHFSRETLETALNEKDDNTNISAAINQMTMTTHEIAKNTAGSVEAVQNVEQAVSEGAQIINATLKNIHRLVDEVGSGGKVVEQLVEESMQIGKVLDVIRDIAEQTNLLALNAAIEAARAGEQGRGFAVVADEVRTLATRTQESTEEIHHMIERLRKGASEAHSVMQDSQKAAEETVGQAAQTNSALETIHQAVGTIRDMSMLIATAAEEQTSTSDEINRNIHLISDEVDRTAKMMELTTQVSDDLSEQAQALRYIIGEFKLSSA